MSPLAAESLKRCMTARADFIERFYWRFFAADPRIPKIFGRTDMTRQRDMLRHALSVIVLFAQGSEAAAAVLRTLSWSHGPNGLDIPAELYPVWKRCLVETIRDSDPEFSADAEAAWDSALDRAIAHIVTTARADR